ncbi:MAG: tetratricopeptide repeat protein [bacterium]|nr:MAG: tetratricopeptide repeat protein [bacterium]
MPKPGELRRQYPLPLVLLIAALVLAGCAGAPPERKPPAAEPPPAARPAVEVIADAEVLAQNNRYDTAATILEELIAREGDNLEAMKLLAAVYAAMGRKRDAVSTWERIAVLDPSDPDAAYEVGISLARKKDWTALRSRMLAAETAGAADARHHLLIGEADLELGYYGEAERYLARATGMARATYLLGKLYYEQGRLAEAEAKFDEVLQKDPDNFSAHLHLGWLHFKKGNKKKALTHYTRAVGLDPEEPLARLSLAALYDELGRSGEAIKHFQTALSLRRIPRSEKKKALNSLSRLLVEGSRTQEAITVIRKGLEEFPNAGGLYFQWGEALLKEGRKTEAKDKYKKAAEDPVWREIALRRIHTIH